MHLGYNVDLAVGWRVNTIPKLRAALKHYRPEELGRRALRNEGRTAPPRLPLGPKGLSRFSVSCCAPRYFCVVPLSIGALSIVSRYKPTHHSRYENRTHMHAAGIHQNANGETPTCLSPTCGTVHDTVHRHPHTRYVFPSTRLETTRRRSPRCKPPRAVTAVSLAEAPRQELTWRQAAQHATSQGTTARAIHSPRHDRYSRDDLWRCHSWGMHHSGARLRVLC